MLDYYGSITNSFDEIDSELINHFKNKANQSYIKEIIKNLKKENIILNSYSISGWNMFHKSNILLTIDEKILIKTKKNNQKLKTVYCLQNYLNDDIIYRIFNK